MDEKDFIQSAKKGNLDAFNSLVLTYQDRVYNLAYYALSDAQAAENTTQKAFISAFHKIRQVRGRPFQVWLLRIVVNLCYEELRRCLNPLPSMVRIAVTLVDIQQLDYVEAAEVMGVPKEVLKCFLSLGRVGILQGSYQTKQRETSHELL